MKEPNQKRRPNSPVWYEPDQVVREFPPIKMDNGIYRVRLLSTKAGPRLDIREFIENPKRGFLGFSKRGIRVSIAQGQELILAIQESRTKCS